MKKLIPHVYMSKDDFPPSLTPHDVLENMFEFFQSWKSKLYDMISFNSLPPSGGVQVKPPGISIKPEEPLGEDRSVSPGPVSPPRYSSSYGGQSLLQETKQILAQTESSCSRSVSPPLASLTSLVSLGRKKKKRERSRSSSAGKEAPPPAKSFKEENFPSSEETLRRRRAGGHLSKAKYQTNLIGIIFLNKKFLKVGKKERVEGGERPETLRFLSFILFYGQSDNGGEWLSALCNNKKRKFF